MLIEDNKVRRSVHFGGRRRVSWEVKASGNRELNRRQSIDGEVREVGS